MTDREDVKVSSARIQDCLWQTHDFDCTTKRYRLASRERFPIKSDTDIYAYMLPANRVKGSIPWEDAIPVIARWYPRYQRAEDNFEQAMEKLADSGGLDHKTMDDFSQAHFDHVSCKKLPLIDWKRNFAAESAENKKDKNNDLFMPRSLSEHILFSTVRIQTFGKNKRCEDTRGFATGFLFKLNHNGEDKRFIITNRHVFDDADRSIFSLHRLTENSGPHSIEYDYKFDDLGQIINHPESDMDLCALPFDLVEQAAWNDGKDLYTQFITPELIPSNETLDLMPLTQEVYMYGYPIGLWDNFNQLPIIRRGSLASHPALNYCGKPTGAIDIASFPGSSGSPIFVLSDGGPISDKIGNVWANRPVAVFLGLMTAGARMKPDGALDMIAIPVQLQNLDEAGMIPIHLGYYIKSEEIASFAVGLAKR